MRLSGLRLPNYACALFLVPLLAYATVSPAGAEPSQNPQPSTQYNGDLPSAAAKSNEAAEPPEGTPGTAAEQPESGAAAAQPNAKPEADTAAAAAKPARAGSQILVNVDKSLQEMTVFVDGIEKYQWPVSTGVRGYSTPSGNFTASSMNKIWYSKQWDNAPMPHAIFFTKDGHAIHGSLETKKLGRAASHGCVRVSPKNAETLFHLVEAERTGEYQGGSYRRDARRRGKGGGSAHSSLSRCRCRSLGLLSSATWSLRLAAGPRLGSSLRASATLSRAA